MKITERQSTSYDLVCDEPQELDQRILASHFEDEEPIGVVIKNVEKSSVIDYPPYISAVVFLAGCNMSCKFCYNWRIIDPKSNSLPTIPEREFISWLEDRKGKVQKIVISGGEPCLYGHKLAAFIFEIRHMGFGVKLDTNGSVPNMVEFLVKNRFIDFISMDVKNQPAKYNETCGVDVDISAINKSIRAIIDSGIDHEFRTTIHPKFHSILDLIEIAKWIKGAKLYSLQQYFRADVLDPSLNEFEVYKNEWFDDAKKAIDELGVVRKVELKI